MAYSEAKVYFDGSHYIAIPHTEAPPRRRPNKVDLDDMTPIKQSSEEKKPSELSPVQNKDGKLPLEVIAEQPEEATKEQKQETPKVQIGEHIKTKKDLFEELCARYVSYPYKEREASIIRDMSAFFPKDERLSEYVKDKLEKKKRNLICRRTRMVRKAYIAGFNYFCTFTYNSELHTEETFRKTLKKTFANFASRKGWKYMGVWERSPEKQRLHFHGLFYIPDGTLPDELTKKKDYSTTNRKMQETVQSEYFNKRFGRNDFKQIDERENKICGAVTYLLKYIEKTGERITYSKGLYQYFISDIMDEDIVCPYGQEEKKLLLFDNFKCWDEGLYMGNVSPDVIAKMRKSN